MKILNDLAIDDLTIDVKTLNQAPHLAVTKEADETLFWFELLVECGQHQGQLVSQLMEECIELLQIFSASLATAKRNR